MDRSLYRGLAADPAALSDDAEAGVGGAVLRAARPVPTSGGGCRLCRAVVAAAVLAASAAAVALLHSQPASGARHSAGLVSRVSLASASAVSPDDFMAQAEKQNEESLAEKMGVDVKSLGKGASTSSTTIVATTLAAAAAPSTTTPKASSEAAALEKAEEERLQRKSLATARPKTSRKPRASSDSEDAPVSSAAYKARVAKAKRQAKEAIEAAEVATTSDAPKTHTAAAPPAPSTTAAAPAATTRAEVATTSDVPKTHTTAAPPAPSTTAAAKAATTHAEVATTSHAPKTHTTSAPSAPPTTAAVPAATTRAEIIVPPPPVTLPPTIAPASTGTTTMNAADLEPLESRHDGNVCDVEEEFFGGLCYRKCAMLTNGERTKRKSPWTCCNDLPCDSVQEVAEASFANPLAAAKMCLNHCAGKFDISIICSGYDVSGDGSCPHAAGACLTDEELHLGVCYKKCSLLTGGQYPYRYAGATCCKEDSELGCLKFGHSMTSANFEVGGGDGMNSPATMHMPMESLTEDVESPTTTTIATQVDDAAIEAAITPEEILNDGNTCGDTEELYGFLCYRKCALLTNGMSPHRQSPFTCCDAQPCTMSNTHKAPGFPEPCRGFDVSGDGGSCPHKAGACYKDEELYLGVCYKSCSILTTNEYPHRSAPATCCKTTGLGCLMPSNIVISQAYDVGGGKGDQDPNTLSYAHAPLTSLTEGMASSAVQPSENSTAAVSTSAACAECASYQVTANGNVNVRREMLPTALVISVQKAGSVVRGRQSGAWLELEDEGGYMMMAFSGVPLLTKVTLSGNASTIVASALPGR
mmetsp:Transcript_160999/g.516796  ORF Transcript_160999/g.516796 Transcript_160999/m.516796 type:complete len:813 (-) Transcript_160999:158-2596(-)